MMIETKTLWFSTLHFLNLLIILVLCMLVNGMNCESPYRFVEFKVHYGILNLMGVNQHVINYADNSTVIDVYYYYYDRHIC